MGEEIILRELYGGDQDGSAEKKRKKL